MFACTNLNTLVKPCVILKFTEIQVLGKIDLIVNDFPKDSISFEGLRGSSTFSGHPVLWCVPYTIRYKSCSSCGGSMVMNLISMRMQVQSPAPRSGLRIWCCHELQCGLPPWLGSGIAVAVA